MARKNFKSDLGELITGSNIELDVSEEKGNNDSEKLNFLINQLNKELHLWRTGKLTVDKFKSSIKEYDLKYDAETNQFSKI